MALTLTEQLQFWKGQVKKGIKYQEDFGLSKNWNRYHDYYWGKYRSDIYYVNKYFSQLRSLVPRLYFRNPRVIVHPVRPEYEILAMVVQAIDNWLIRELNLKSVVKSIIQDAFFCNKGFVKIGYDREFGQIPFTAKSPPTGEIIEYNVGVKSGMPWALRTNPRDFIVSWGVNLLNDTPWVAHRIVRLLEDVKKDPTYEHTKDLKGGYIRELRNAKESNIDISGQTVTSIEESLKQSGEEQWVEIWEIRDVKHKQILALNLNHDKFLRKPQFDTLQIEGAPFIDLTFNPDNDVFWGPSDASLLEGLQLELNEIKTQASQHRKVNLLKFLFDENKLHQEEFEALMDGEVGTALGIPDLTRESIVPLQPGEPIGLRQDAIETGADIRETMGFSRTEEGEYAGPPRRTKAEIQAVQGAHWIRVDERRDILADFLLKIVSKINQVIFQNWTVTRVIPVVGIDNAVHWVQYTGPQLRGEYDLEVNMDTGRPVTTEVKRAEAEKLREMFINDPNINLRELDRSVLKLYEWIDVERVLIQAQGQGNPQRETLQQFMGQMQGMKKGLIQS